MLLAQPEPNQMSNIYCGIYAQQKMGASSSLDVLLATIPLARLRENDEVLLLSDLTNRTQWAMHQLVQRNINDRRVREILDQFLRAQDLSVKFFPSITVVLLPITEELPGNAYVTNDDGQYFNHIDGLILRNAQQDVAEIQANYFASLSWDQSKLKAIVVDGQHRVKAIREFIQRAPEAQYQSDSIPAAFLILPTQTQTGEPFPVLQATRKIFIDINNTPKNVSEQRLIFIDDRNILRRITAHTLGLQIAVDNAQDIYQQIELRDRFEPDDFTGLLNRFIVGEDSSDDEFVGRQRNHEQLLPWEVTHIMTLHEQIIKDVLLARDKRIGLGADLKRLCQIIHRNLANQYEQIQDGEDYEEAILSLRDQGFREGAISLFEKFIKARHEANEQRSGFDQADPENDDQLQEIESAYLREMQDDYSFFFRQEHTAELMRLHFATVSNLVCQIFNGLWFVQQLQQILTQGFTSDQGPVSADEVYRLVYETEMIGQVEGAESGYRRARLAVQKMTNEHLCNDGHSLERLLEKLRREAQSNALRKIVGQQALFIYFRQIQDGRLLEGEEADVELEFINRLGETGFFDIGETFKIEVFNRSIEVSPLSGTILKADGNMNPGLDHAKKAASLLLFIRHNVFSRPQVQALAAPNIRLPDHTKLVIALGNFGYKKLEQQHMRVAQVDQFIQWAAQQDNLTAWLTEPEATTLHNRAEEEARLLLKSKKVIGGMLLESIVSLYQQHNIGQRPSVR